MRIAAYNVENLFDRAKVFNDDNPAAHRDVLDAHAELNKLFELDTYSAADRARMLDLMDGLGILNRDEGPYVRLRRIRGQLIRRPRDRALPREIVATGRDGWIGWLDLKTEAVDETAMMLTARAIFEIGADVLAVVEAESRPTLQKFQRLFAEKLGLPETYRHLMLIDGNDDRGIDVALATRAAFPIGRMQSHVDLRGANGQPVFSRDCPVYEVATPGGQSLFVLPNHFKSKFGGNDPSSRAKRRAQAQAVADIYRGLVAQGATLIAVVGDLNDTPGSPELQPLLSGTDLRDATEHPAFTEVEFRANNGNRGIGTYGLGNDGDKIDYLLLSPALFGAMTGGGLFRKGAWPGTRPPRWETYAELTRQHHAASDHHLIWADVAI